MAQQQGEEVSAHPVLTLFYCYARKDKALRDEIDVHLAGLHRSRLITSWYDGMIIPGADWEHEIDTHLKAANIILLLVSPDFLNSDYCYGREMQQAIDRHTRGEGYVIPILLRPTDWEDTPFSALQMLPTDAKPVTQWIDQDAAFADIARGIRRTVNDIIDQKHLQEVAEEMGDVVEALAVEGNTPSPQRQTTTQPNISPIQRRLVSRIPYASAFLGGLAVQVADLTWIAIITQPGDNGQYLVHSNASLNDLAVLIFLFAIILDVLLVIHGMVIMARLKHRRWFIGLLLGSIGGAASVFLPGLALMVFGLFAPRTPAASASARRSDQTEESTITSLGTSHTLFSPTHSTIAMATDPSQEAPVLNQAEPSTFQIPQKIKSFLTAKASFLFRLSSISLGASVGIYAAFQAINANLPHVDLNQLLDTSTFLKYYPPFLAIPLNLIVFLAYFLMFFSPVVFAISGMMSGKTSFLLKVSLISLGIAFIVLLMLTSANAAFPGIDAQHTGLTSTYVNYYPPVIAILLIMTRDIMDVALIASTMVVVIVGIAYGVRKVAKRSKSKNRSLATNK